VAYGERVGEIAAELAVHFEQGRDLSRAVHYLITAGETAMQRNAHQEAIAHFTHGLELLVTFPDTPERKRQELALQVALGAPLLMTKGYAAPEVAHAYGRARELCQQIGEQPDLFPTLVGLGSYYLVHGELPTARELTEQCVRLAEHAQDPALLAAAYFTYGVTLFYQGELTAAQATLAQGSRFYTSQASGSLGVRYGQDPGVACHGYGALTAWLLGYPDQALGKSHEALTLARQLSHSYSLGFALHTAGWLHQYRQDRQQLQEYAEEVMRVSQEEGFALWLAVGMILRGWVLSQHGEEEQGLAQMQEGLPTFSATGAKLAQPYHIALLAQARGKSGQPQEGLALLDQAFEAVDKTGERYYEAELYRLKGTLALQKGARDWELETGFSPQQAPSPKPLVPREVVAEVEGYFHKALDIARRQEAKSLELRAATSLARLWQQQDKVDEARELLQEIYHWFTEGFETKDLQAAETLLVSLGGKAKSPESKARSPKSKKAEGTSSLSPYSLQPIAYSLPQPSVLGAQSLSSLVPNTQHLAPNTFYNEGEYWSVSFAGETCRLKDARGLHYIAQLLQQPHQEIHVITLITVGADGTEQDMETPSFHDPSVSLDRGERFGDAGAMLDPQARAAYKQRLSELREELAEAQRFHDLGRSEHLAAEIDFLTHELSSAIGLGGRARHMGSHAERARVNITRSIKIALRKISEHHPVLGQHLATTLKTGAYCSYTPDKRMPIVWLG
jgi:predicted ATPase